MRFFSVPCANCKARLPLFPRGRYWWRELRRCPQCTATLKVGSAWGMLWVSAHILPWFGAFLWISCAGRVVSLLLLPIAPLAMIWGFKLSARTARVYAPGVWEDAWVRRWELAAAMGIFLAPALFTTSWIAVAVMHWLLIDPKAHALLYSSGDLTRTFRVVDAASYLINVNLVMLGMAILVLSWVLVMQTRAIKRAQGRASQAG